MIAIDSTHEEFLAWLKRPEDRACSPAIKWVRRNGYNVREAWAKCKDARSMWWFVNRVAPNEEQSSAAWAEWGSVTAKTRRMRIALRSEFLCRSSNDVRAAIPDPFSDETEKRTEGE